MKKKIRQIACVVLMISLMLATIRYEVTPVQAAGVSSGTEYYTWHRAYTPDDLKKYTDSTGKTTDYKGKWVPIIIVACYGDSANPTMYYWNRECKSGDYRNMTESIPYMTRLDGTTSTGIYLQNAISSKSEDSFVTRGDMGAMHMYYHGEQSSARKCKEKDVSIVSEAWSLTSSDVEDFSSDKPDKLWGFKNTSSEISMDLSNVQAWYDADKLPLTRSIDQDEFDFEQAWTFYQDNTAGQFLIANLFAWPTCDDLNKGNTARVMTIGGGYAWFYHWSPWGYFYEPDPDHREVLMTPYVVANNARIVQDASQGKLISGDAARRATLEGYNKLYTDSETRASFRIYVGEQTETEQVLKTATVTDGSTLEIGYGNVLKSGSTIEVQEGGTLIIPEDGLFYLNGTIYINGGTMIVGRNSCITSEDPTDVRQTDKDVGLGYDGRIEAFNGGKLLIQESAKVYLNHGLKLDDSTCTNSGILVLNQLLDMNNAQLKVKWKGYLALGFSYGRLSQFFKLEKNHASANLSVNGSINTYRPSLMQMNLTDSKVILYGTDINNRVEMSALAYKFLQQKTESQLNAFTDSCLLFDNKYMNATETTGWTLASGASGDGGSSKTVGIRTDYNDQETYTSLSVNENLLKQGYMILKMK